MLFMIDTMVYVKSALIGSHYSWTPLIELPMDQRNLAVLTGDRINEGFLQENVWQFCSAPPKIWLY